MRHVVQVEWPEQQSSQQPPGSWDPLQCRLHRLTSWQDYLKKLDQRLSVTKSAYGWVLAGAAAALAAAVGFAWLYMGS